MNVKENLKSELFEVLVSKGITPEDVKVFLESNSSLYEYTPDQIRNKISVIFNGNEPYAIILCDKDSLSWCTKSAGHFHNFVQNGNKTDYIVQMMVGNAYRNKVNNYLDDNNDITLEGRMKAYRDISSGAPGYNIR